MVPQHRTRQRPDDERHTKPRQTKGEQVSGAPSHREVTRRVREADRFALQLPVFGRVPFPTPDQLAFYGALAGLVAIELIDWPVAVAIGIGHAAINGRTERTTGETPSESE